MQITPLVLHAARRLPALSTLFSDAVSATSIAVVAGDLITITAPGHGLAVGTQFALSISDAETPNPITAATVDADGNIVMTTQYPHDLTMSPAAIERYLPWDTSVKLSGFGSELVDGTKQLISVTDRYTFTMAPTSAVTVTLDGGEVLLEWLPRQLIGYHKATVISSTQMTIPTPSTITRDFTVSTPVIAQNIRVFGTLELDTILRQYVRDDEVLVGGKLMMFIAPVDVRTSRSRNTTTDALADLSAGSDYRLNILDGFDVYVVIPTEQGVSAVKAVDLAQGDIFAAVLGTFFGVKIPRPEICGTDSFVALLEGHSMAVYNNANYIHRYRFQAMATLTNVNAIAPHDWPDMGSIDFGDFESIDTLYPVGTGAAHDVDLTGIRRDGHPGALEGNVNVDDEEAIP